MVTPTAPSVGSSFLVYSIFQVSIGLLCKLSRRVIKWVSLISVFGQLFFLIVILLNKTIWFNLPECRYSISQEVKPKAKQDP